MKKNLYFRTVLRRENVLARVLSDAFVGMASYPRKLIEVFLRKDFGERYFSIASAIFLFVLLALVPWIAHSLPDLVSGYGYYDEAKPSFWGKYATWYAFTLAFGYFAWRRWLEVRHNPSVFDFEKFSLYAGTIHPKFFEIKLLGPATDRNISIFYEPALFFIPGLVLYLIGQNVGMLFMVSALCYGISYAAAYREGDHFVMDKIDEMILNEELEDAFVNDEPAEKTRGVRFYAQKPSAQDLREKVSESFVEEDEPSYAV